MVFSSTPENGASKLMLPGYDSLSQPEISARSRMYNSLTGTHLDAEFGGIRHIRGFGTLPPALAVSTSCRKDRSIHPSQLGGTGHLSASSPRIGGLGRVGRSIGGLGEIILI